MWLSDCWAWMQWPESRKERGTTSDSRSQVIASPPSRGLQAWPSETTGECRWGTGCRRAEQGAWSRESCSPGASLGSCLRSPALRPGRGFHPHPLSLVGDSKPRQAELGSAFIRLVLLCSCTVELRNKKACWFKNMYI